MKKLPKKFASIKSPKTIFQKPEQSSKSSGGVMEKNKLPSNSRTITEENSGSSTRVTLASNAISDHMVGGVRNGFAVLRAHWEVIFISFISGILLMAIGVKGLELRDNWSELQKRESLHEGLKKKMSYWEGIVKQYPDYKDAFFQLAIVSYQLGEKQTAKEAIEKVLEIDPNDSTGRELLKKMGK